jgi:hypothetical protein
MAKRQSRPSKEANARAQAAWRARREEKLAEQAREIAELKAQLEARDADPAPVAKPKGAQNYEK